ncbi:MAG: GGDEF domain-containing protein [Ruminococcus sp.]|nr:GGDEF domain-containing protein [Ruminococcus sp.]
MNRFKIKKLPAKLLHKYTSGGGVFTLFGLLTVLLLISVLLLITIYFRRADRLIKEHCCAELTHSTDEACADFENIFRTDRVTLSMVAKILSEEKFASERAGSFLDMYELSSDFSNAGILTSKNTVVLKTGDSIDVSGKISYENEIKKGEHINGLQTPVLVNGSSTVIRSYIPVVRKEKQVGLVFAEMDPDKIAHIWSPQIYGGDCIYCVIDRASGKNVLTGGYDSAKFDSLASLGDSELTKSVSHGSTGFRTVSLSSGSGDDVTYYASFKPLEIADWELLVMVSKEEALSSMQSLSSSLYLLLGFMTAIFAIYLALLVIAYRRSIEHAEVKANVDVLTGLRNRNLFEQYCAGYDSTGGLVCIYVDANGLHELNNTRGHLAGDQMLQFVANELKTAFGEETVFRIGGDEFIAFCRDTGATALHSKLDAVNKEIERNNYHISAGVGVGAVGINIKALIKVAEDEMYEEKKRYYERIGAEMRNKKEEPKDAEA